MSTELHTTVLYSCPECGLVDVPVPVPSRTTEDVVQWFEGVMIRYLGVDHARRSPHCHPNKLRDVKIPMPAGTDRVGGAVKQ